MEQIRETFIEWLRDAHAAEKQALTILNGQAGRIENYPELQQRIRQHVTETEQQVALLDDLLARYGESGSLVKDAAGRMVALGQNLSGMIASDEIVKGALFSYAFEQMEIASYRILISTAETLGDAQAVAVLRQILSQEEQMAAWLLDHIPGVLHSFFQRLEAGETAKR